MAALDTSLLATKRIVYVGGLGEEIKEDLIRAAFIPFGNIKSVMMPMDYQAGTHKGFAFVDFEDADDASESIFNMDGGELMGRTLRVSLAQPNQINKFSSASSEAIWKSDEWFQTHVGGKDEAANKLEKQQAADLKTLQDL